MSKFDTIQLVREYHIIIALFTRCSTVAWLETDNFSKVDSGFMYCCTVEDLKNTISNLPDLSDENGNWPALLS